VTVRSEILLNPGRQITGVRHAWTFDQFYTAMAMQGVDTNGDGILSKEELKPVVESMVNSLEPFDYFTNVHFVGVDKVLPLKPPERYSLDYDGNALTLHFTLLLEEPVDASSQKLWRRYQAARSRGRRKHKSLERRLLPPARAQQ
jgi:ABC-type uncharacterized transport system substrate-binding protein